MVSFKLLKKSKESKARLGVLSTAHGKIETPFFMPVATLGSLKSLDSDDIRELSPQVILGNTYHLLLQPGEKVIKKAGGLHNFMDWQGPILTDSGGYQVFSLGKLRKVLKKGVEFQSHIDGKKHLITPEKSIDFQANVLKSDMIMSFDECPPFASKKEYYKTSMDITTMWAARGMKVWEQLNKGKKKKSILLGIVQGGTFKDLRELHTKQMVAFDMPGYALGGLAVGEPTEKMYKTIDWCEPLLPENKPRYLMGTGYPEQLVEVVKRGMDMFDCVIPTREARHGRIYLWNLKYKRGVFRKGFYKAVSITNAKYRNDMTPINNSNLKGYTKAYLSHLFRAKELTGIRLATLNNLSFYLRLMEDIRFAIRNGKL